MRSVEAIGRQSLTLALLLVACGGTGESSHQDPAASATGGTVLADDPRQVVDQFVEVMNTNDSVRAREMLSDEPVIHVTFGYQAQSAEGFEGLLSWFEAGSWHFEVEDCPVIAPGPPEQIGCVVYQENAWSRARGVDPVDADLVLWIGDDELVGIDYHFNLEVWSVEAFVPFNDFVRQEHPESLDIMWSGPGPNFTPESLELFEKYSAEFARYVADG